MGKKLKKIMREIWHNPVIQKFVPAEIYIRIQYKNYMGKPLNLKNPKTFNEKIQWLKLYDRNPKYTRLVDKFEVRKHITDKIGKEHLIPILGLWDKFEDIDFDKLPVQFVLKPTHTSGNVFICKDKSKIDYGI